MTQQEDRLIELLTERAERALSADESAELETLLEQSEGWHINDFDFASAAAHMALDPVTEPMPEALKARIIGDAVMRATSQNEPPTVKEARPFGARQQALADVASKLPAPAQAATQAPAANDDVPKKGPGRLTVWLGWSVAAAACVLAVFGWQDEFRPPETLGAMRAALVAESNDMVKVAWTKTEDPLGTKVSGDVVWSNERQEGYMRFAGLPKNDPGKNQYQLWIFDADRDERFPVDGGVFDIDAETGEAIVAIKAKIPVNQATLFAITLEKPGGVVVSTRERLVTLAKPSA